MQLFLFRTILIICLFSIGLVAKSTLYTLPEDAKASQSAIIKLIKNSKHSISIAMYNLKYKKFIKQLKKAKSKGVDINLYLDANKVAKSKIKFIKYKTFKNKLHIKAALFDNKTVVFGSANWKKESFTNNMEIIYISDDKKIVKQFKDMFKKLSKIK
jgi:phosphatidylserine/phosphatidylglycerophosphate/cardiolipin synthase-like enzyme